MAKFVIDFTNKSGEVYERYADIFTKITKSTARTLRYTRGLFLVEVMLVKSAEIKALNHETRQKDVATDVLSFSYYTKDELATMNITKKTPVNLGSIVINVEQAITQAKTYSHTLERELKFLYVHGLLHLFGYDHKTTDAEAEMIQLQNKIIGKRKVI